MPITVKHVFSNAVPDGADTNVVRPSDWNSAHAMTLNLSGTDMIGGFSNANGISFGTNTGGYITGSHNALTTAMASNRGSDFVQATAVFGGTNVSGTIGSSGIRVSVGDYITTARASNDAIGTNTALTANGVSMTANSSGLSLNFPAFLTTARSSDDAVGLNTAITAGPLAWTVNSSGLSLNAGSAAGTTSSFAGNSISGSMTHNTAGLNLSLNHPAWLTTAAQSNHSHGNPTLALTNLSGTTASDSGGFTLSLSANTAGGGGAALSAGTQSVNTGTVAFVDSNGITFGMSGSNQITASHNGLTTARASNDAIGLNTALTAGPLAWTVNSSGISLNAGSAAGTSSGFTGANISGSMTHNTAGLALSLSVAGPQAGVGIVAGTRTATTAGSILFDTGNGITFGLNAVGGSVMTASHNGLTTAAQSDHSHGNPTLSLAGGLSGATASNSAGFTLSLTQASAAPSPINFSAGTTTSAVSGLTFSNGGGVSFGLGTGGSAGVVTATVKTDYLTTARASNDAIGTNTALTANGVSMTANSSGLSLNFPAFLTTARSSDDAVGLNTAITAGPLAWTVNSSGLSLNAGSAAGTTSSFAGNSISGSMTHNTAGLNLSLNHPAWLTTAAQSSASNVSGVIAGTASNAATNQTAQLSGAVSFANGSGVSFFTTASGATSGIAATVKTDYLTTARASTDAVGLNTALTAGPLAWTVNSSGISLNAGSAAGTTTGFAGANISGSMTHNTAGLNLSLSVAAPGGGGVAIAGGTQTATSGTVKFADSNGITFGMSGSTQVTANHAALTRLEIAGNSLGGNAATFVNKALSLYGDRNATLSYTGGDSYWRVIGEFQPTLSDIGNTSGNTGTYQGPLVLAGGNNITLSQSTGTFTTGATNITGTRATITISGPNVSQYLTTARASNDAIGLNTALTANGVSVTANSSGLSLNFPAFLTTAMQSNAATISNINLSAGTTSTNASAFTFANGGGVSFGLGTGASAGSITATVKTDYLTTARASTDAVGLNTALTAGPLAWTVNSSGISLNAGSAAGTTSGFTGANISGSITNNTAGLALSLSVAGPQAGVGIEAGTRTATTAGNIRFETGNGITFGLNAVGGSVMTASHNGLTTAMASDAVTLSNIRVSAGTTSNLLSALTFSNANNITWGLDASTITASFNPIDIGVTNSSASGTTGTIDGAGGQYLFFHKGAATLSQSVNGKSASLSISAGRTIDGFTYPAFRVQALTLGYAQSTSHVVPFVLPADISFDFIRLEMSGAILAASTTAATTGNTQFSCGYTKTHNFHLFSRGAGANSDSLQLLVSTQFLEYFSNNVSCAANSTQFSYSNRYTYPCSTGNLGFTNDYSSSVAGSMNFNSASATAYTGTKYIDFPFGTVLTAGRYWLMYGNSTSTASQVAGRTEGIRNAVTFNPVLLSQAALSIGTLGAATSAIYAPQQGLGSFTTVGGATTNSLNITHVTNSASHPMLSFQLMRTA